ncbi:tyrosine-type recombinase/integrase [Pseudoalteromonas sp. MIP2626]|uniref:tyrosine-type recombinase/integrase n=1 Tax=Pseudoalteromonas sp. MIP2626 TaxID=2705464 RepID=UPI0015CC60CC|nr:tyrosine-type recombinase/integrase [Pseudoalteromonas sp. MIP2626]NYR13718.1 tyrosine-type recombinase/integrase [Pseudoalteromonas sp. MIP2626]
MELKYGFTKVFCGGRNLTTAVLYNEGFTYHKAGSHFLLEVAKKSRAGSKSTVKGRASDLARYLNVIGSSGHLYSADYRKITESQMNTYLMVLVNNNLQDVSINRHISTLSEFYSFAFKQGYIDEPKEFSYSVKTQSARLQLVDKATSTILSQYIREEDFNNILAHIPTKDTFKRFRDEMALKVGYFLGVRTHELVKYGNFDIESLKEQFPSDKYGFYEEAFIKITGKGYKRRSVPICMELKKDLFRFLYGDLSKYVERNLFEKSKGVPMTSASYGTKLFRYSVDEYLSKNIVPAKLRDSYNRWVFHSLRHTCATNLVTYCEDMDMGRYDPMLSLPQWMGHEDDDTTKLYICAEALLFKRLEAIKKLDSMSTYVRL